MVPRRAERSRCPAPINHQATRTVHYHVRVWHRVQDERNQVPFCDRRFGGRGLAMGQQPPPVEQTRPSHCSGCKAPSRPFGQRLNVVGHGKRQRQVWGPLKPQGEPCLVLVWGHGSVPVVQAEHDGVAAVGGAGALLQRQCHLAGVGPVECGGAEQPGGSPAGQSVEEHGTSCRVGERPRSWAQAVEGRAAARGGDRRERAQRPARQRAVRIVLVLAGGPLSRPRDRAHRARNAGRQRMRAKRVCRRSWRSLHPGAFCTAKRDFAIGFLPGASPWSGGQKGRPMSKKAKSELHPQDHGESVGAVPHQGHLARWDGRRSERGELAGAVAAAEPQELPPAGGRPDAELLGANAGEVAVRVPARGLGGAAAQAAQDEGPGRALTVEQRELLCDIRREHPSAGVPLFCGTLCQDGRLAKDVDPESGLRRLYQARGWTGSRCRTAEGGTPPALKGRAARGAVARRCVPRSHSLIEGSARPLRIHALLDDASPRLHRGHRRLSHRTGGGHAGALCPGPAMLRRPRRVSWTMGPPTPGPDLRLCCERLGERCMRRPGIPRPAARWSGLAGALAAGVPGPLGSLSLLHEVQVRLFAFVDQHYHNAPHAGLMGAPRPGLPRGWTIGSGTQTARRPPTQCRRPDGGWGAPRSAGTTWCWSRAAWETDRGFLAGRNVTVACLWLGGPTFVGARWGPVCAEPRRPQTQLLAPVPSSSPPPESRRSPLTRPRPNWTSGWRAPLMRTNWKRSCSDMTTTPLYLSHLASLGPLSPRTSLTASCGSPRPRKNWWPTCSKPSRPRIVPPGGRTRRRQNLRARGLRQQPPQAFRLTYCHNYLGPTRLYRQLCGAALAPAATAGALFHAVSTHVQQLSTDLQHPVFLLDEAHLLHQDTLDHLHILAQSRLG